MKTLFWLRIPFLLCLLLAVLAFAATHIFGGQGRRRP